MYKSANNTLGQIRNATDRSYILFDCQTVRGFRNHLYLSVVDGTGVWLYPIMLSLLLATLAFTWQNKVKKTSLHFQGKKVSTINLKSLMTI